MSTPVPRPEIIDELSFVYELSLAIGTSLDLQTNCDAFVRTLLARENLDYAAIWIADRHLPSASDGDGYTLVYAYPTSYAPEDHLPADHPLFAGGNGRPRSVSAGEDGFSEVVTEQGITRGTYALLALGELGLLKLYTSDPSAPFRQRTFRQLENVLDKFANSLQACLSHGRLLEEIRERERIEQVLRRRDRAMASTNSGMIIVDALAHDMPIIYCNPAFENITGYGREELLGRNCRFLQGSDTDPAAVDEIRKALREERECQVVLKNYRRDGTPFWNELKIAPIWDEAGRVTHFVGVQIDVTDRVRAEQELREAKGLAEHLARTREQFLANMSHEIRTPLNAVIGMAHLLQETPLDAQQQQYINTIQFSADTLLALLNDILDYAKIESGKIAFEQVPFHIEPPLQGLLETVRFQAEEGGLSLELELDDALPPVLVGDSVRLNQILLNLLGNALKFTERGGITLRAEVQQQEEGRVWIRFRVADTGIGMPEDKLAMIFESFTQASSDTTRKYGGTGLGLAIVKELTERMGGRVGVSSAEGKGSEFTVLLPFGLTDVRPSARLSSSEKEPIRDLTGARILVVEDNEINQLITSRMLTDWGAVVEVAAHGREAVDLVRGGRYDLVLMDIQMPVMDGYEATYTIRQQLRRSAQELPILALTASVPADRRPEIEAVGMNDFIVKPFDPADLRRRVAAHLARAYAYRPSEEQPSEEQPSEEQPSEEQPAPTEASTDAASPFDLALVEESAQGRQEFVLRVIDLFLEQMPPQLEGLEKALAEEDWPRIHFLAHRMKASAGMFGMESLREALDTAETYAAREAHLDRFPALIDTIARLYRGALEELQIKRDDYV